MKKRTIFVVSTVTALLGLMTWTLASNKKEIDANKEIKTTKTDIAVSVARTEMKDNSANMDLVGTTQACKEVFIASEGSGKIVSVNFKMGDYVAKGKVLAKIDDTYKKLAYQSAELNFKKSKEDLNRYTLLQKGNAISEVQMRDIQLAFESASIQLQTAKKQWDDTQIVAPFSGYITSLNTEVGAFVNPGVVIAGIADISYLKVVLEVSESNAYQMHQGQSVRITSDVNSEKEYTGTIATISQKATAAHTYPTEIRIANNGKEKLKAGSYVNVQVDMGKNSSKLMIPRDAIVSSVKNPSVYVVKDNIARLVRIGIGRNVSASVEVLSGLSEGDLVVTNGQINLSDGAKVSVI